MIGKPAFPVTPENTERAGGHPGLSAKEYAAIMLSEPSSGTQWLDEMIARANKRREIAGVHLSVALLQMSKGENINPGAIVQAIMNS